MTPPLRPRPAAVAALLLATACAAADAPVDAPPLPAQAAEDLLASDRAFGSAHGATVLDALGPMLAADVIMPGPGAVLTRGRRAVLEALGGSADNLTATLTWRPAGGGVSADGLHGFTWGYMTQRRPDGTDQPWKYLAYWIRGAEGWRVAAYKRRPAPGASGETAPPRPLLPPRGVAPVADSAVLAHYHASLAAAEQAFSDEAQRIGLGSAFAAFGTPESVNIGGPQDTVFVRGAEAIAVATGGGEGGPSPISWSAEETRGASSGDLGVTFGFIRANAPDAEGRTAVFPFFTVWRRGGPGQPWRYVAE